MILEENAFTHPILEKLKRHPKRIVFPEAEDARIWRVAAEMTKRAVAIPILLGERTTIREKAHAEGINLDSVNVIDPKTSSDLLAFAERFAKIERYRKLDISNPEELISNPHYFGAMMVQYGQADGIVGGNTVFPATYFRALLRMIKPLPNVDMVSSCMILVGQQLPHFGPEGILFLADCGVIPDPSAEQLSLIAVETGKLAKLILEKDPHVAMLSYSTKGSAKSPSTEKMVSAVALARVRAKAEFEDMLIGGELQVDAALVAEAAQRKAPQSLVAGKTDVLIFPNLDSSHIAFKLLYHVAGAQPYGQIVLGLSKPAAQIARTATEETIFGTAAIVGLQAITHHEIYLKKAG